MSRFTLLVILLLLPGFRVLAQTPQLNFEMRTDLGARAKMRDAVELSVSVYRPAVEGKFPVILLRTPYNKGSQSKNSVYSIEGRYVASRGYVHLAMDVRGRRDSDGACVPQRIEGRSRSTIAITSTGRALGKTSNLAIANQTTDHDREHLLFFVMPVVPDSSPDVTAPTLVAAMHTGD